MRRKGMSDTSKRKWKKKREINECWKGMCAKQRCKCCVPFDVWIRWSLSVVHTSSERWWVVQRLRRRKRVHDALPPHSEWIYWTNKVHEKCTQNISIMLLPLVEMVEVARWRALLFTRQTYLLRVFNCVRSEALCVFIFLFATFCCHFLSPHPIRPVQLFAKRNSILLLR